MFITKEDLLTKIKLSDLTQIVGDNELLINHSINLAIGKIKPYLSKYNTDKLFSEAGDKRDPILFTFAIDIAIYEIIALARPNIDMTDRRERKNEAIEYLQNVKDGVLSMGWELAPPKAIPDSSENPVVFISTPPRGNRI